MTIQRKHLAWLMPKCREEYKAVLCSDGGAGDWAWATMAHYGINHSVKSLAGWLATFDHETGGGTILFESLTYTSTDRLKAVWPSRFVFEKKYRKEIAEYNQKLKDAGYNDAQRPALIQKGFAAYKEKHEAWVASLLRNEKKLAGAVYAGRMGNRDEEDAFNFRGTYWHQFTGRSGALGVAKKIGVDLDARPELFRDMKINFIMTCVEWKESGCNELCNKGNFKAAFAAINVGGTSPEAIAATVDMPGREQRLSRALQLVGQDPSAYSLNKATLVEIDANKDGINDVVAQLYGNPVQTAASSSLHWTECTEVA